MKPIHTLALAIPALALGACTAEMDDDYVSDAPAARVVGEAVSCIPITQISSSQIHDNRTIDFDMTGTRTYRNTLPHNCSGLKIADSFTYETSLSSLCNTDIIYPLENFGGTFRRGAGCGLGEFVPIEYIED